MGIFIVRRILVLIPVALLVLIITFSLIHLTPGNPAYVILGEEASKESVKLLDIKLGLNLPLTTQFFRYVRGVVTGHLGHSLINGHSVLYLLISRLPVTAELSLLAMVVALVLAVPAGVLAAVHRNSWIDNVTRVVALTGIAMPNFWLALLLVYIFAVVLRWFPALGWVPLGQSLPGNLYHLVLPVIVLALPLTAVTSRILRGEMLEVLHLLYIQAARAKGVPEPRVLFRHALRNALIPVVTVVGLQLGALLGGVVITETIFTLPGMGQLVVSAIFNRDYPVLDGAVLFLAWVVLTVNLLVDIAYAALDPRIRYQ